MKSKIQFVNSKIEESLEKLRKENPKMHGLILRAFKDIEENVFCGIQIPKRLIPKEYVKKYNINQQHTVLHIQRKFVIFKL